MHAVSTKILKNPDTEMRNITEQFSICLRALTWLKCQILPCVQGGIVPSIKSPSRNGDGSFLADTSSLVQIGRGSGLWWGRWGRGGGGGWWWAGGQNERKHNAVGKREKCEERARQGIRNSPKGSLLISWLTWLWLSPGWEWNVWCPGTRLISVTNLHLSFPLD